MEVGHFRASTSFSDGFFGRLGRLWVPPRGAGPRCPMLPASNAALETSTGITNISMWGGLHMTNTEEPAVLVGELAKLELSEERPVIYDRPIGVRLLYSDPRSGAEHYLIRYPVDLRAQPHRHSAAHTIVVLEGVLLANDQLLLAGSYAHFPRGALMRHEPAAGHYCLFVIVFDGPFDVAPLSGESG